MKRLDFLEALEECLPEDWEIHDPDMAPDVLLECPHGHVIEMDGRCPDGCVSPLINAGLV